MKKVKRKHRWATAKGQVVSVRLSDLEYETVGRRAEVLGLSVGEYLRWLSRLPSDKVDEVALSEWR